MRLRPLRLFGCVSTLLAAAAGCISGAGLDADGAFSIDKGPKSTPWAAKTRVTFWRRTSDVSVRFVAATHGLDCTCSMALGGEKCEGACEGALATYREAKIEVRTPDHVKLSRSTTRAMPSWPDSARRRS